METPLPSKKEIEEMVQFLPRLYSEGFNPVKKWGGGVQEDGSLVVPWPEYDDAVDAFRQEATKDCWRDTNYTSNMENVNFENDEIEKSATLEEIRTILTFCIRGERFCDGHITAKIKGGTIKAILKRLEIILDETA